MEMHEAGRAPMAAPLPLDATTAACEAAAPRHYVFIDYENVQPKSLDALGGPEFCVQVFLGAAQLRISTDLVVAMQALAPGAKFIRCSGNGSNALDFHIAFYVGEIACREPAGYFHIVSKDTGFDPLVAHLRARGLRVWRSPAIEELPMLRPAASSPLKPPKPPKPPKPVPAAPSARLARTALLLQKQGKARPATAKALDSAIHAMFQKTLSAAERASLVQELRQRGWVAVNGTKVSYALPA